MQFTKLQVRALTNMNEHNGALATQIRECDKKIVDFIKSNGGQAYEKDIRNQLQEPRTTIWRAIKRLELQEILVVQKLNHQNLVKLIC